MEIVNEKDVTVLILAAGNAVRIGGECKQLLHIGNTTILGRIIKQVRERGYDPVVVTHHEMIQSYAADIWDIGYFVPEKHSVTCETLLSTESLWTNRTIVLLGDVIYSNATMDAIFDVATNKEEFITRVFGDHWEVFAIVLILEEGFDCYGYERIRQSLESAKDYRGGKLRFFYRLLMGFDIDEKEKEGEPLETVVFYYIHDWTRDIDMPSQYERALIELVNTGVLKRE